jgi:uncharacterized protein (DUF2147 family)
MGMKFKFWTIALAATLFPVLATSASAAPAAINGNWFTKEKDAIIKVAPCGAALCGTIAKYLVTPPGGMDQRDTNNPDKNLRNRKLLGSAVLINFVPDGNEWKGKIYDARNGKTYRSVVYRGKSGNLIVKGCLGPFCQTQSWSAAN